MKNISFDYLFESDIAKIVQKQGTSNTVKIEALKKMIPHIIKNELTKKQRLILKLYFVKNLKYCQIAKLLKINKSTVSRTKQRAFNTIYKILKYYYFK